MSLVSYCNSKGCLKQASTSKPGPLATAGSCYSSSAHWLPCAAQAAPRRSCQCPGVRRIECLTRCSSSMAAESSTTAAQLPRECPAEATTAAETPSKATESVYDKPTAMAAGTAAASLPQITLTPLQPLNGGSVSQGSMGEWRDAAVDQGYIIHQQQRQQQQQQQQRQQPKHKAAQKSTRNNITTPAAEQQSEQKAATKHTPVGRLRKHKWILSTGDRLARQTGQQKRILAGQQQQRQHWWQSTGKGGALTANLTAQRTAPGLLHLLQTAWSRRTRVNIIHLAAACRSLVDIQQQQGKGVYSSSAQDELLQMMETLLTEQLTGAATAAAAGSVQKPDAGSGNSNTAVEATGTSGTQPAAAAADVAGPSAADAVSALRSLSTLVYSWAKLQHKPPTEVMQLLLDAFLVMLDLQQQQQQQDVQHQQSLCSSCEPEGDQQLQQQQGSGVTSAMDDLKHSSSGHVLDISSNTPSSSSRSRSSRWMHSLSNLCWGLAKISYNCNVIYGSSSKSSYGSSAKTHQQQQQLDLQQQYWSRLAAAVTDGVSPGSYTAAAAAAASISARDLSSLCYSFAAGGYKDVVLWGMLSSHVITSVNDFQPQELSSVLWAYATAGMRHKGVFAAAAPAACQLLPGFSPQGLVNTLWAYQTALGHVPADLLAATVTECIRRSNSSSSSSNGLVAFGPMHLSMLVWACGMNQVKSTALASAVCDAAAQLIDDFQAQDLCRLLHGLNVLQPVNNKLFDAAELKLLSFLESGKCNVQTMVQGVGAYAKINHPGAVTLLLPLLQLAEEHVTFLIRSGDATARLLKTLAALRYRADGFVNVLAQKLLAAAADTAADNATAAAAAAVNHLTRWDTRALAITAAAIAKLGHSEQTVLLKVIMQEFNARLQAAAAAAAAASSSRGRKDSKVPVTRSMLAHCALLLWCAAVCDMRQDMPLLLPLAAAMQQADASQFSYRSLAQLVQVHMWAETLGSTGKTLISTLPKPLMDQALSWWQIELVPATVRSTFHNEVLAELTAMRLRPVTEGVTPDGMFSVDCIVRFKGCEVALEVMGDQHYSVNEIVVTHQDASQQQQQQQQRRRRQRQQRQVSADDAFDAKPKHVLLGPDALRMRLLAARGYAVAAVSSFEWEGVRDRGKGQALLRQKLEEAVRSHRAAAGLAAAGDQQQQHRRSHGTQGQQQVNHKTSKLLNSNSEGSRQQQQQGGNVDVVQQVAHVLQQQGRSATLVKGKLKRQQYWQQRRDRDKEGMMLLTMAAPWVAAKNQSGSNNSSGAGRGHDEESTFADSAGSADVASGSSSSSGDGSSPVGGTAVSVISDKEFDMPLDLEELLLE